MVFTFNSCLTTGSTQSAKDKYNALKDEPPEGCENSLIYKYVPKPKIVGGVIRLGNMAAMRESLYTKEQALNSIYMIKGLLDQPNLTYFYLMDAVNPLIKKVNYGTEVMMVSTAFMDIDKEVPLDPCDRELLLRLTEKLITEINSIQIKE